MLNERENGKVAVTRILSGVDDITINGSNKNRATKKEEMDLVSSRMMLQECFHEWKKQINHEGTRYVYLSLCFYSITMRRREMASRRVINCEHWRARGRPGRHQAHSRKYPGSLWASSVPRIITYIQCYSNHLWHQDVNVLIQGRLLTTVNADPYPHHGRLIQYHLSRSWRTRQYPRDISITLFFVSSGVHGITCRSSLM